MSARNNYGKSFRRRLTNCTWKNMSEEEAINMFKSIADHPERDFRNKKELREQFEKRKGGE